MVDPAVEVLLVHPGGPYWRKRDRGAWQIPKGLIAPGETAQAAARREAEEELGFRIDGTLASLGTLRQASGKWVDAFAVEQDIDTSMIVSNTFTLEWPRGSGREREFPEVDQARWFPLEDAEEWILTSQVPFLERLAKLLQAGSRRETMPRT